MTKRTVTDLNDVTLSEETFSYDAAGNLVGGSTETGFVYDTNNRLISIDGEAVSYDADGNMLSMTLDGEERSLTYDSANRLLKAGDCEYAYNAEDIRIRNLCGGDETLYTYDTNAKLSRLLVRTASGVTTKYVYGMGLIGEETAGAFKTYHFDYRGSTVAITDSTGAVTDTFQYDTYGKLIARTGTSEVIFRYNGRDGVITDSNSLLYMRARYYSPELRRFINADIIAGEISNAVTLNRYAYANGNPVSNVDPFGLCIHDNRTEYINSYMENTMNPLYKLLQTWGISLTKSISYPIELLDILWGGFTTTLSIDVSFQTPLNTPLNTDIAIPSGETIHEIVTPDLTLPWTELSGNIGLFIDKEKSSAGISSSVSYEEWTYKVKHQIGLKSESTAVSVIYTPEDKLLPSVSLTVESEIKNWAKLAVAVIAVAVVFAPEAIIAYAPSMLEFLSQVSSAIPTLQPGY